MTPRPEWAGEPPALTVAHDIPGRLRLRLPRGGGAAGLRDAIERLPGVERCMWSPRTRSLLITYTPGAVTPAELTRTVAEHADVALPGAEAPQGASVPRERPGVALALAEGVGQINHRLVRLSGGRLDLPILVSLGLAAWGIRQLVRGPITALSWTSAFWYAHGLFRDYHAPRE